MNPSPQFKSHFVAVALPLPVHKTFDYRLPDDVAKVSPGTFVKVPLGKSNRNETGVVLECRTQSEVNPGHLKSLKSVLRDIPPLSPAMIKLARWMASYYACPLGMVLKFLVPPGVTRGVKSRKKASGVHNFADVPVLNGEQQQVFLVIKNQMILKDPGTSLLWGVTGSGKTEVYLHAILESRKAGKGVIWMVPEIALTPQLFERARRFLGREPLAMFHSRLSAGERAESWRKVARGEISIVLGARSSLFAPVKDLGLIVVDEEHERSYKQEEMPRYQARDVAVMRGKLEHAHVLLGSATPSLESFLNSQRGKYQLLRLKKRFSPHALQDLKWVRMPEERRRGRKNPIFSEVMLEGIKKVLARKEQAILFLNRRGFSNCLVCTGCGQTMQCPHCDLAMTYHKAIGKLVCHRCDERKDITTHCLKCGTGTLKRLGFGTEKVDQMLKKIFPAARIGRIDSDTVKKKGTLEKTWEDFQCGALDVLIGTQMIAKGLDVSQVTLVGVLAADLSLNIPDFRAGESTFQLILQVAGRAGRGHKPGSVIIQTESEGHPIIDFALKQDYEGFFKKEMEYRQELGYPPKNHFIRLVLTVANEKKSERLANKLHYHLKGRLAGMPVRIKDPAPGGIPRIRGKYIYQILLATNQVSRVVSLVRDVLDTLFTNELKTISIDVDPYSMV